MSNVKYLFFALLAAGGIGRAAAQMQYQPAPPAEQFKQKSEVMKTQPRAVSSTAATSLPRKISYQGLLTTAGGAPVADGSYDLTLSLYDSLTTGSIQWTEAHAGVPVQRGTFSISLGESTPLTLAFDKPMFVQVAATGGPAGPSYPLSFAPRSELTSAPYSLAPWVTNGTDIYYKHGNIGIGSSAPESSKIGTLKIDVADEDGNNSDIAMRVAGGGGSGGGYPIFNFAKSYGSLASPTMVAQNNALGQISFLGYDGANYQASAGLYTWIDSTPAVNSIPAAMSFYTYNRTRGWSEKMRLDRNGSLSIDGGFMNDGALKPGLVLGGYGSGEGLASKRTGGGNQWGIDFYTAFSPRMSISNSGYVGIGTTTPSFKLDVKDSTFNPSAHIANVSAGSTYGLYVETTNSNAIPGSSRTGIYSLAEYARVQNISGYFYSYGIDTSYNYAGVFYGYGGSGGYGVYAAGGNYAGYFAGNLAYTGSLINASDENFKEGVQDYTGALDRIMKVKPRTYTFKSGKDLDRYNFSTGTHYGFIAQELEEVFPELVTTVKQPADLDEKGNLKNEAAEYKGIKTLEMIPILLQAIQEQQKRIDELQAKVARLENK